MRGAARVKCLTQMPNTGAGGTGLPYAECAQGVLHMTAGEMGEPRVQKTSLASYRLTIP